MQLGLPKTRRKNEKQKNIEKKIKMKEIQRKKEKEKGKIGTKNKLEEQSQIQQ